MSGRRVGNGLTVGRCSALLGIGETGTLFGVFLFGAMLFAVQGFLRYGWPYVQRYHERREPAQRNPTSMRFQGFSADTRVFLTLLVATMLVVFGMMLLELYLG